MTKAPDSAPGPSPGPAGGRQARFVCDSAGCGEMVRAQRRPGSSTSGSVADAARTSARAPSSPRSRAPPRRLRRAVTTLIRPVWPTLTERPQRTWSGCRSAHLTVGDDSGYRCWSPGCVRTPIAVVTIVPSGRVSSVQLVTVFSSSGLGQAGASEERAVGLGEAAGAEVELGSAGRVVAELEVLGVVGVGLDRCALDVGDVPAGRAQLTEEWSEPVGTASDSRRSATEAPGSVATGSSSWARSRTVVVAPEVRDHDGRAAQHDDGRATGESQPEPACPRVRCGSLPHCSCSTGGSSARWSRRMVLRSRSDMVTPGSLRSAGGRGDAASPSPWRCGS